MNRTAGYHQIHAEGRAHQLRRRIALEAARLISEHGIHDYQLAKRKAARRVGVSADRFLPRNREIDEALREHQRLFRPEAQSRALQARRRTAREAMHFLERFQPRLVGAVLDGTADLHSPVRLHVFDDSPEDVVRYLSDHGIVFEARTRTLRLDRQRSAAFPILLFDAGGIPVDVTVFPHDALRQAPLDYIDERPQRRASLATLDALLATTT